MRTKEQIRRELEEIAEKGLEAARNKNRALSASLIPRAQELMRELDAATFSDLIKRGDELYEKFGKPKCV